MSFQLVVERSKYLVSKLVAWAATASTCLVLRCSSPTFQLSGISDSVLSINQSKSIPSPVNKKRDNLKKSGLRVT